MRIRNLVRRGLNKVGFDIVNLNTRQTYALSCFLDVLKQCAFSPQHILDIGANVGNWTREAMRYFPDAEYTLVEPQDELKVHVQDLLQNGSKVKWVNAGAAERPGQLLFTRAADQTSRQLVDSASTFRQVEKDFGYGPQVMVPVTTINDIVRGAPVPGLVKIDTEGFDLKVLAGASDILGKTSVFLVEAAVACPVLDNTILAVIERMHEAGYHVVDITDLNRTPKSKLLWLCELAFLKNDSSLLDPILRFE